MGLYRHPPSPHMGGAQPLTTRKLVFDGTVSVDQPPVPTRFRQWINQLVNAWWLVPLTNPLKPPIVHPAAASGPAPGGLWFTLDRSTLAVGYRVVPSDMEGSFRDIQFHLTQATDAQDMEVHYLEFHATRVGVSKDARSPGAGGGSFLLDTSVLGDGPFLPATGEDMQGSFRDVQIHLTQAGVAQDMEVHYLELNVTLAGVSKEN